MHKIYLISKLYNFDDKIRTCKLEKYLKDNFDVEIYMPYRDSKEEFIEKSIWKEEIFRQDIEQVDNCDIVMGYVDGVEFDEGIGFEIGYAIATGKKVIMLNSDFVDYVSNDSQFTVVDPFLNFFNIDIVKISHNLDFNDFCNDLEKKYKNLLDKISLSMEVQLQSYQLDKKNSKKYDYFIELGNNRFFSNYFKKENTSNRLLSNNIDEDLQKILSSKKVFVYSNGMQMHFGSAIICGICYALEIPFYIVDDRMVYLMGGDLMKTNLMIDVSSSGYIDILDFYEQYKV